ncbi:adenylate/guanylate cyclase domain-containing protein [Desulfonatronum thiodismutans]|uniref:adenylate/guanylate cyclase domain-containing protein n=1 Tax=Desulfonatronum thiodismutans TaxID=159290 RepID=UPI0004ABEAAF|nr:adenylate/guanylate cyclase domain-containing protein [Desulfonatronum thiodismutans]
MPTQAEEFTVLFADLCQSRRIYLALGDEKGHQLVSRCLSVLTTTATHHQGELIKTIGDEILCLFPSPDMAVAAAMEMHQAMATLPIDHLDETNRPGIHIGLHSDIVIRRDGDVFGDPVNIAARLTTMAKNGQILTSERTLRKLCPEYQAKTRFIDNIRLKGQHDKVPVYEVIWEEHDLTVMCNRPVDALHSGPCLKIFHGEHSLDVDRSRTTISLGRHASNDIHVPGILASRIHARIELRKGKFILIDQSTNGTHVLTRDGRSHFVHRDEFILTQDGCLGIGHQVTPEAPHTIAFILASAA